MADRQTSLNVCAANFSTSRPSQNIAAALAASKRPRKRDEVDLTLLPSDDVTSEDGFSQTADGAIDPITIEDEEDTVAFREGPSSIRQKAEACIQLDDSDTNSDEDLLFVGEDRPAFTTCKICGSRLFAFSAAAHKAFHEKHPPDPASGDAKPPAKKRKTSGLTTTAVSASTKKSP